MESLDTVYHFYVRKRAAELFGAHLSLFRESFDIRQHFFPRFF